MTRKHNSLLHDRQSIGLILMVLAFLMTFCAEYDGANAFLSFMHAAAPWLMLGLGLACLFAAGSSKQNNASEAYREQL